MTCCGCCSTKVIGCLGVILSVIFGCASVAGIVLGGLQFEMLNFSWVTNTNWSALGIVAIVAIVVIGLATIYGIVEFCCCKESCCCGVIYLIFQMIVLLFALAVAIFGLVSGSVGVVSDFVGCNTEFKGILDFWNNFDYLFQYLDYGFCSVGCQCDITPDLAITFEAKNKTIYDEWKKQSNSRIVTLSNCTQIETQINTLFDQHLEDKKETTKINVTKFGDYWGFVEEKFNCTGWCEKDYTLSTDLDGNIITPHIGAFIKFIYAGINIGVVGFPGCMESIVEWLPPLIQAYGIVGLIASICCFLTWILACMLVCKCHKP